MSVIGLDIGTTGCKAIVFGRAWQVLGKASREYPVLTPRPDWAEQDAELVWRLALETLAEAVASGKADPPCAMALSVQGEAVIPVDQSGRPLRHAILGMDNRSTAENAWLAQMFDPQTLFQRTGMPIHTVNTLPKLLWLQRNEPEVWTSAAQFLLYEDYFLRRLTGNAVISHCLASRTQMYDLQTGDWATDILERCAIDPSRLAPLAETQKRGHSTFSAGAVGSPANEKVECPLFLDKAVARQIGVSGEVLLVSGGHDQACAALGSGVIRPGLAMVSTGTAEVVEVAMAAPVLDERLRQGSISIYRHVVPGLYVAMTLNHSGGLALRWFRDTLCRDKCFASSPFTVLSSQSAAAHGQLPAVNSRDAYDLILADAPAAPTGLLVLPHFSGGGTPQVDPHSRAAILGMTFATTQGEIAKAILEGLTYELRTNLELLRETGIRLDELHAVGGGARSNLWLQMKADICRTRLRIPQMTEAACLGAAILASVGAGQSPDIASCVADAVRLDRAVEPGQEQADQYDRRYQVYRKLYPVLKPLYGEMSSCSDAGTT
ncbi:MAG: FGGY family carbohydrate kinase [Planctomycetes bacterium]|jgi:xylulokinase|nr:FGGY family carbohydrate kinase [Planctomycetota bacterium]